METVQKLFSITRIFLPSPSWTYSPITVEFSLTSGNQDTCNLRLVQAGYCIPYFIYPNAVSPTEDGEWNYDALQEFRDATQWKLKITIWASGNTWNILYSPWNFDI